MRHAFLHQTCVDLAALTDLITSAYLPVRPFPDPPEMAPTLEVEEFVPLSGQMAQPYTVYRNHLYIYPRSLKYDGQKAFPKVTASTRARSNTTARKPSPR